MFRRPGLCKHQYQTNIQYDVLQILLKLKKNWLKIYLIFHRKSFFSGHASFSMFTMLYLAVSDYSALLQIHHNTFTFMQAHTCWEPQKQWFTDCTGSHGKKKAGPWFGDLLAAEKNIVLIHGSSSSALSPHSVYKEFCSPFHSSERWMDALHLFSSEQLCVHFLSSPISVSPSLPLTSPVVGVG